MRAITQRSTGGPEVLEVVQLDQPAPGPDQVLIEVRAIGVNPSDWKVRSGHVRRFGDPPFTLGLDFSGTILDVGPDVSRLRTGQDVFGCVFPPHGSYAECIVAPHDTIAIKPASTDHVHAAALPIASLTAWQSLVNTAHIHAGQRVLIHGAAGGVGHLAVQIAKAHGAYVIGTARATKHPFLRELGVDEPIDYTTTDFSLLRNIDIVLDTISGEYGPRSLHTLTDDGMLIDVVGSGIDRSEVKRQAAHQAARFVEFYVKPASADLNSIARLVDHGQLHVQVEQTMSLDQASKAHELSESGHVRGKIVLIP